MRNPELTSYGILLFCTLWRSTEKKSGTYFIVFVYDDPYEGLFEVIYKLFGFLQ